MANEMARCDTKPAGLLVEDGFETCTTCVNSTIVSSDRHEIARGEAACFNEQRDASQTYSFQDSDDQSDQNWSERNCFHMRKTNHSRDTCVCFGDRCRVMGLMSCSVHHSTSPRHDPFGTAMSDCLQNGRPGWCQRGRPLGRQSWQSQTGRVVGSSGFVGGEPTGNPAGKAWFLMLVPTGAIYPKSDERATRRQGLLPLWVWIPKKVL